MLSTTTRTVSSELGAPDSLERIAKWLDDISRRTATPARIPLSTPGGIGAAGRAAQDFGLAMLARHQGNLAPDGGNTMTALLDRYKISSSELQGFSERLIHWSALKQNAVGEAEEAPLAQTGTTAEERTFVAPMRRSQRLSPRNSAESWAETQETMPPSGPRFQREALGKETLPIGEPGLPAPAQTLQRTGLAPSPSPATLETPGIVEVAAVPPAAAVGIGPRLIEMPWMRWMAIAESNMLSALAGMAFERRQSEARLAFETAMNPAHSVSSPAMPGAGQALNTPPQFPFSHAALPTRVQVTAPAPPVAQAPAREPLRKTETAVKAEPRRKEDTAAAQPDDDGSPFLVKRTAGTDTPSQNSAASSDGNAAQSPPTPERMLLPNENDPPTPDPTPEPAPVNPMPPSSTVQAMPPTFPQMPDRLGIGSLFGMPQAIAGRIQSSLLALSTALAAWAALPASGMATALPGDPSLGDATREATPGVGTLTGGLPTRLVHPAGLASATPLLGQTSADTPRIMATGTMPADTLPNPAIEPASSNMLPSMAIGPMPLQSLRASTIGPMPASTLRTPVTDRMSIHRLTAPLIGDGMQANPLSSPPLVAPATLPLPANTTAAVAAQNVFASYLLSPSVFDVGPDRMQEDDRLASLTQVRRTRRSFSAFAEAAHAETIESAVAPYSPADRVPSASGTSAPVSTAPMGPFPQGANRLLAPTASIPTQPGIAMPVSPSPIGPFPQGSNRLPALQGVSTAAIAAHALALRSIARLMPTAVGMAALMVGAAAAATAHRAMAPRLTPPNVHSKAAALPASKSGVPEAVATSSPQMNGPRSVKASPTPHPSEGQITLVTSPLKVTSEQAEEMGTALAFDWRSLLPGIAPLDSSTFTHLAQTLPSGVQAIYPALSPSNLGPNAVNLPLAASLLHSLLATGYGSKTQAAGAAAKAAEQVRGSRAVNQPLAASIVPAKRPTMPHVGLLPATSHAVGQEGSLAEVGTGQATRGGAFQFMGMPMQLAPSQSGSGEIRQATAQRGGHTDTASSTMRPAAFDVLRKRLFPSFQSIAAEPDPQAWEKVRHDFGLPDTKASTLFAPDALAKLPSASSPLPQIEGGTQNRVRPLGILPSLALPLLNAMTGGQTRTTAGSGLSSSTLGSVLSNRHHFNAQRASSGATPSIGGRIRSVSDVIPTGSNKLPAIPALGRFAGRNFSAPHSGKAEASFPVPIPVPIATPMPAYRLPETHQGSDGLSLLPSPGRYAFTPPAGSSPSGQHQGLPVVERRPDSPLREAGFDWMQREPALPRLSSDPARRDMLPELPGVRFEDYVPLSRREMTMTSRQYAPGRARGLSRSMSAPMTIQRSEIGKSPAKRETEGVVQTQQTSTLTAPDTGAKSFEVHLVANEVWAILKRRIAVEAERSGRR